MTVGVAWPLAASAQAGGPDPSTESSAVWPSATGLSSSGPVPPVWGRQALSLRAGMAELVLLNRLRARTRREPSREMLERAATVIGITARHWWGPSRAPGQA